MNLFRFFIRRRRVRVRVRTRRVLGPRTIFSTHSRRQYLANREAARAIVTERVGHFAAHYAARHGIAVGRIAIRNQRSRWGSCSKKGNLNFNYKLVFLPSELRDYVIVHELCHIKEFNHGRGFWELVGEQAPEWKELRRRLRKVM